MKKPRVLTFVSEEIVAHADSLQGTTLEADVIIVFKDQDEKIWMCNKVVRCKLRKEKAPAAKEVAQ